MTRYGRNLRLILFCFAGILQCTILRAQLPHIVKDYNNCTEGLQNEKGEWIVKPIYDYIAPFQNNHAIMRRGGLYGVINSRGKEVIAPEWADVKNAALSYGAPVYGLYVLIGKNDTCTLVDTTGRRWVTTLFPFNPYFIDSVSTGTDGKAVKFVHLDGSVYTAPPGTEANPKYLRKDRYEFIFDSVIQYPGGRRNVQEFHGVIDSKGKIIVPALYQHIKYCGRSAFPAFGVYNYPYTGYYSIDGKKLWDCIYTTGDSYDHDYYCAMDNGYVIGALNNKYGVMGWNGDTLVPFAFDEQPYPIKVTNDTAVDEAWIIHTGNKFGIYNYRKGWLLDTVYTAISPFQSWSRATGYFAQWYICCRNNKWGVIGLNNDTLVPIAYDEQLTTNGGMLFVSDTDAILLRMNYDHGSVGITKKQREKYFNGNYEQPYYEDESDDIMRNDTVITGNDLWTEHYMFTHPEAKWSSHKKWSGYNPYPFLFEQAFEPVPEQVRLDTVPGNQGCTVFCVRHIISEESYYEFDEYTTVDPQYWFSEPIAVKWRDEKGQTHVALPEENYPDTLLTIKREYGSEGIMTRNGHVLFLPGRYQNIQHIGKSFVAYDNSNNYNTVVLDSSGRLLYVLTSGNMTAFKEDTVWLSRPDSIQFMLNQSQVTEQTWVYNMFDLSTLQYVLDTNLRVTFPFDYTDRPTVMQTKTGAGIIDPQTLKIYITPRYAKVIAIDDFNQFYAVQTCNGKVGIVDSNNVMVADTVYDNLMQLTSRSYDFVKGQWTPDRNQALNYVLTDRDRKAYIFNSKKGLYHVDSTYGEIIRLAMLGTNQWDVVRDPKSYNTTTRYNCPGCKANIRKQAPDSLLPWQNVFLYHLVFSQPDPFLPFNQFTQANHCLCPYDVAYPFTSGYYTEYNYFAFHAVTVAALTDSSIGVAISPRNEVIMGGDFFTPKTMILFPDGAHEMTLDSLFTGSAWQNVITDSLLSYLRAHKNIDADCSRPGYMVNSVNQRFLAEADGLHLFPQWYANTDGSSITTTTEVIIPWKGLDPYLRPDVKTKLPGH